jgi:hypothetical protein
MAEKSDIEKYFLQILPEIFPSDECRGLLTLVAGERPGVLLMSVKEEDEKLVKNFCEDFGLELEFMGERNELLDPGAFITDDLERFSMLEDSYGNFYGCSDGAVGKFLGYPEEAIEFYSETEVPGEEYRKKLTELHDRGEIDDEDLRYLQLVDYVPRPEKENILRAVEEGKRKEKALERFDEENNTRVAEMYLTELFNRFDPDRLRKA